MILLFGIFLPGTNSSISFMLLIKINNNIGIINLCVIMLDDVVHVSILEREEVNNIMNHLKRKNRYGTTLIELMTSVFIISIMASLTIPVYKRSVYKSEVSVCQANLRNIVTALQAYQYENHKFPETISDVVTGGYIKALPKCSATHADTYSLGYEFDNNAGDFTIHCSGHNHKSLGYGPGEPYYNFSRGMGP